MRFYRDVLQLHVYREFAGGRGVVFFLGGGFLEVSGSAEESGTDATQLWLQVRDVDRAREELEARGAAIEEPPADKPWGLREMGLTDPDGRRVVLVEVPPDHPLRRDVR